MRRGVLAVLLALSVIPSSADRAVAQGQDQIYPLRGSVVSGIIVNTTPAGISMDVRGEKRNIAANEIRRVNLGDEPLDLRRAREDILEGQLENGLEALKRIDAASISRDLVRRDLQYYIVYCQGKLALTGAGDKVAAEKALRDFLTEDPNNFHFYEGAELLGDLATAQGNYEQSLKYYSAVGRAPWPDYQMRATVSEAGAFVAQGKFSEAIGQYDRVLAFGIDTPEATRLKLLAQVGRALCLAETGKPQEGITILEAIIANNDPQNAELFGRSYNALGRCYLKENRPKDALMAYLHVHLLFFAVPEVHAESLYYLGKLWPVVYKDKPERAAEAHSLLREQYAGSVWAKRD